MNYEPIGVKTSRLLSILRGVQIRGSSLNCINITVLRNVYGHPHEATLERLFLTGTKVWMTAEKGAVTIVVDEEVKVNGYGR